MTTRQAAIAAAALAAAAIAALIAWWHTGPVQYLWDNVLPPSFWTLTGLGIAHWRQMEAHKVTQVAMLSEHTAARKAHRISADLYRHWTGHDHQDAPRGSR